jgi:hypothetical protein|tara:strand:- start:174 stop:386 length:213 start_codon:yes stop_codon:yes gene_type:complete
MEETKREIRCSYCGESYENSKIVGKINTVQRGVRFTYEVALCICKNTYRGNILSEEKLPPRKFSPRKFKR